MASTATERITKAPVGREVHDELHGHTFTVAEACDENSGQWYCVTHGESFQNQMQKDSHVSKHGQHELAWVCWSHGYETP